MKFLRVVESLAGGGPVLVVCLDELLQGDKGLALGVGEVGERVFCGGQAGCGGAGGHARLG